MRIDITGIAGTEGAQMKVSADVSAESLGYGIAGVEIDGDVLVCLKITYTEGKIHALGTATGTYRTRCARCLEEVKRDFTVDIDEYFVNSRHPVGEGGEGSYEYNGTVIDFTDSLRDNILLNLPTIVLCKQDCKGLCEICGNNLNKGDCGCIKDETDIRMEKLKDFFKE